MKINFSGRHFNTAIREVKSQAMHRASLGAKIFAAIVAVSVVTSATTGAILFWHGSRLVRLKSTGEVAAAASTLAHFVEHNLEDALRHVESSVLTWVSRPGGQEENLRASVDLVPKQTFLEHARYFLHLFPWVTAVSLRDGLGHILLSYGEERLLAESLSSCDPIALFPKGCFARGPEPGESGAVVMEFGLRRTAEGKPWPVFMTFVVDLSALSATAPLPKRLYDETIVLFGRPGRADGSIIKAAPWVEKSAGDELTSRLGQIFLSGRHKEPMAMSLGGQEILVVSTALPKLQWPLAVALPMKSAGIPQSALLSAAAWAGVFALVLSLVVAWGLATYLVRPLRRLQEAFREFSQGRWDIRVPVTTADEIGELTDGFNEGVAYLNTQHQKLKRFQTLVHQAQDAVVLCSPKGTFFYANPSAHEFFGFLRRGDALLTRLHDLVCPTDREKFEKTIWPLMLEGPWEGELHFCRQDGKRQVGWLRAGIVPGEAGEANFVYAIIRDISDRKAAEKALRDTEEYYRTLFRTSRDAIVVTDVSDAIVDVNEPGFPNMFGYLRHEVLGRPLSTLLAEEAQEPACQTSSPAGRAERATLRWRRKDGSLFAGEATLGVLKDGKDALRGYVRVIRDVSEREGILERLEQAYNDLKSVEELKDKFLAGISHDLRTPLIPVRAFLEKLLQGRWGPVTERQEEFLRYCLIGVSREMILVEELLDYTRIKSGSLTLRKEKVDLQDVLRAALFLLKILAETNRLTVAVDMPVDPVPILGDYNKLLRIFHNLFSNAVKYNRPGGHVTVRGKWESPERFRVSVEDSGIGIPHEDLRRIFDDFYRVGISGTVARGSGIGLAVVRELVRLHGAELDVQSTLGVGSVFTVVFPVMPATEPEPGPQEAKL